MENRIIRKGLVLGIILLFVGTSVVEISGANKPRNDMVKSINQSFLSDGFFFDRFIPFLMKFGCMPSLSACIVKDDEVVWARGYGLYDVENEKHATEDTIYLTASISKTVTATALMQLIENESYGIDLDDDVNNFIPFSLRNPMYPDIPITFRMLLAHQSSLAVDPEIFYSYWIGDLNVTLYPWIKEYLTPDGKYYMPEVWSDDMPGEKFHYANVGYCFIGYLIELISGQEFNEYCKEHIFKPLGMYNTSFRLIDLDVDKVAVPYNLENGKYHKWGHYDFLERPAGAMRTSTMDLSHFFIAHMNGGVYNGKRILKESTVQEMHTVQYPGVGYGLGWQVQTDKQGKTRLGHMGTQRGVFTDMGFCPSDKTGVIIFTNTANTEVISIGNHLSVSLLTYLTGKFLLRIERLLFQKANEF